MTCLYFCRNEAHPGFEVLPLLIALPVLAQRCRHEVVFLVWPISQFQRKEAHIKSMYKSKLLQAQPLFSFVRISQTVAKTLLLLRLFYF